MIGMYGLASAGNGAGASSAGAPLAGALASWATTGPAIASVNANEAATRPRRVGALAIVSSSVSPWDGPRLSGSDNASCCGPDCSQDRRARTGPNAISHGRQET